MFLFWLMVVGRGEQTSEEAEPWKEKGLSSSLTFIKRLKQAG